MTNPQVIIFGEVLFDCFPDGNIVLGGAPFNVAWNLQAFGISPLFISRIGNDSYGEIITKAMTHWGMNLSGLQMDEVNPTGMVKVKFIDNEPHYDIVKDSAYDFIDFSLIPALSGNTMLYHGTLGLRNSICAKTLQNIKTDISPSIFFDVNLRSPWWNLDMVKSSLKQASSLKLNEEELSLIVTQEKDINQAISYLFSTYPLNNIILTLGKAGAIFFSRDNKPQEIIPSQNTTVIDTVGAGDAFCSVLILGMIKNWDILTTLTKAQEFASAVVGIQGATTKDKSFYDSFLTMDN